MSLRLPPSGCAWITGASSGIGRELAVQLAKAGWTVAISARRAEVLHELAQTQGLSGKLVPFPLDVTNAEAVAKAVADIESQCGPLRLAVLNAGTYVRETAESWSLSSVRQQLETNLYGVVAGLVPVLAAMRAQGSGQVAIVSSVAGYVGIPGSLGYGMSKAALINLAEALAPDVARHGIKLQVICPGFVKTPLTDKNDFPMPFVISVEDAAKRIIAGLGSARFEIAFPRRMVWLLKLLRLLPYPFFMAAMRRTVR